ncbi:hypothetical protein [Methylibium petroleiphilum]|uniref:hypothetical protein n=1 Tax=Methylibium petroleiphilum TaxID=105560 RepID=UPI003D2D900B
MSVLQREVPVLNPVLVRTIKPRGSSGAGRPHDAFFAERRGDVVTPKPAATTRTTSATTEYRVTKQAIGSVAPVLLARGWWSDDLQRWTGVDPRPQPATVDPGEVLPRKVIEKRLGTAYDENDEALAWKSVWERISSDHPGAKVRHGHYDLSRVEDAISAMRYTCKTGGLARGVPNSVFDLTSKATVNRR